MQVSRQNFINTEPSRGTLPLQLSINVQYARVKYCKDGIASDIKVKNLVKMILTCDLLLKV